MNEEQTKKLSRKRLASRINVIVTVVLNVVLLFGLIACLVQYIAANENDARELNVNSIKSISNSKSIQAKTLLNSYSGAVESIYKYCNGKSVDYTMEYISNVYADNDNEFQLLKCTDPSTTYTAYSGFSTNTSGGSFVGVEYISSSIEKLVSLFEQEDLVPGEVEFTSTFTNYTNGSRSFSPYCVINLTDGGEEAERYILMNPQSGSSLIRKLNVPSQYTEVSTAIFSANGDYLAFDAGYKAANFYEYLKKFSNISMEEKNNLKKMVQNDEDGTGVLNYLDAKARECTYVYSKFNAVSDWYVVVCVPYDDFVSAQGFGTYPLAIILILVLLLVYDMVQMLAIIKRLRVSVANEKIANTAKTDFLSRMSHDIRTPMNGIMGLTDLTLEIKDLPEEARQNLRSISSSNKYLVSLINDILDMNVISAGKLELHEEIADVEELITNVAQLLHSTVVDKSLTFVIQKKLEHSEIVMLDKVRVKQILMNILSNAIKYTNVGGRIDLSYYCLKKEGDRLYYTFIIKDTGLGMSPEFAARIFEPFSREYNSMTSQYTGTGLGMSIVKTLVDLMNGTISIESEKNKGTEVTINLSFKIADIVAAHNTADVIDITILNDKRVLLVDDHPINITIAKKILETRGVFVDIAENGEIAVEKFKSSTENYYDAILMDVKMPVMDGIEATKIIRKLERVDAQTVPIIAMTANAFAEDITSTKNAGMNAHLAKPLEKDLLLAELSKHIFRRINNG